MNTITVIVIDKELVTTRYVQPSENLTNLSGKQVYFFRTGGTGGTGGHTVFGGTQLPKRRCVKVEELRPNKYTDLKHWMENSRHILVTRHGRIFVNKVIFTYPASEWANPYKVSAYSLDKCLQLYEQHLRTKLQDNACLIRFKKLQEAEELGCFCLSKERCQQLAAYYSTNFTGN